MRNQLHLENWTCQFQTFYQIEVVMYRLAVAAVLLACRASSSHSPSHPPAHTPPPANVSCEDARLRCAYRSGCGMALQNYIVGCSAVLKHSSVACPEVCQHALIALTSTEQGADLMTCDCQDALCRETKERVEVCRPQVTRATRNESIVSCRVAEWICSADGVCSTALDYYHRYCRSMFQGKKCTHRCKNSISILRRQEKAAKLTTCVCDGREGYDCERIRNNMATLCYPHAPPPPSPPPPPLDAVPEDGGRGGDGGAGGASGRSAWSAVLLAAVAMLMAT